MTEREAADIRLFGEITRELFAIEKETDLERKVHRYEQLGAKLEFVLRVWPALGDRFVASEFASINRRIELARDLIERLYEDGENWKRPSG